MEPLTDRQTEILRFIRDSLRDQGAPPTRAGIAQRFGFSSPNAAERHLRALEAKGYIELAPGSARNIRLLAELDDVVAMQFELPLVGRIAAGSPITAPENIESRVVVDPVLFRPRADFLHRVSGHSMREAGILDGDLVGIHQQATADNGQIVAAALWDSRAGDERITLKRYQRRGSRVTLKSENSEPGYAPIELDLAALHEGDDAPPPFRIAGIFAGLIRAAR
jgi:repressor LexA